MSDEICRELAALSFSTHWSIHKNGIEPTHDKLRRIFLNEHDFNKISFYVIDVDTALVDIIV